MLEIGGIEIKLKDSEGEPTRIMPGDRIFFQPNGSRGHEVWTFGFVRGGSSKLYFSCGDDKQLVPPSMKSYEARELMVEMVAEEFGCCYKALPSPYNRRYYEFF